MVGIYFTWHSLHLGNSFSPLRSRMLSRTSSLPSDPHGAEQFILLGHSFADELPKQLVFRTFPLPPKTSACLVFYLGFFFLPGRSSGKRIKTPLVDFSAPTLDPALILLFLPRLCNSSLRRRVPHSVALRAPVLNYFRKVLFCLLPLLPRFFLLLPPLLCHFSSGYSQPQLSRRSLSFLVESWSLCFDFFFDRSNRFPVFPLLLGFN